MPYRILIAEDSEPTRHQLQALLEADGFAAVDATADGITALARLTANPYHVALTDLRMPGLDGLELIARLRSAHVPTSVIVTTGHGSIDQAVRAVKLGAFDFLPKPVDVDHLKVVIAQAAREHHGPAAPAQAGEPPPMQGFYNVLGQSPAMQALYALIEDVAATTTTVLIEGETGTGKEMLARALHAASLPYRPGPLVAVNCAALPEHLIESELFGHEKGAFTGADRARPGRFELAHGGTLFLDEVGELPPAAQIKLLRVLQERKFERVGGIVPVAVDVRLVAASNQSLRRLVRRGKFREDLYYRLDVLCLKLPPLRERAEDIPLLADHFAAKHARPDKGPRPISPAALERLTQYAWPGNIRELENALERACVVGRGAQIEVIDLPPELHAPAAGARPAVDLQRPLPELLKEAVNSLERQYLALALKQAHGHVGHCAKICGLSRRSISAKLAEYGLDKEAFRGG